MNEKILKYLYDIELSCSEIDSFIHQNASKKDDFLSNLMLKRAVERNLEIIGEAVRRITHLKPDFPITNAQNIIGLRNTTIHGYDQISDENIWSIIDKHLPILRDETASLIKSMEDNNYP
jgi:uncharacterized protein with HEPN domain